MKLPRDLQDRIVDFLTKLPDMQSQPKRKSLLITAGIDDSLSHQILFDGPQKQFFILVVAHCMDYGTLEDGRHSVEAILEAAQEFVGPDKKEICENLLQELRASLGLKPAKNALTNKPENMPEKGEKVSIIVGKDTVTLKYDGKEYHSPNRINDLELNKTSSALRYGEILFEGIIHGEKSAAGLSEATTSQGFNQARIDTNRQFPLEIQFDPNNLDLYRYKWEYLVYSGDDEPLAVSESTPLYRKLHGFERSMRVETRPLRILVIIASPSALGQPGNSYLEKLARIDVPTELDIFKAALAGMKQRGIEYTILDGTDKPVTPNTIQEELEKGYHIVHLLSHGVFIKDNFTNTHKYFLIMDHDDQDAPFVSSSELKLTLLTNKEDLRLVILASCQSAGEGTVDVIQGLGPQLVKAGIPAMIAIQGAFPISTAQRFTQHFYDDLLRSGQVDRAMAATRRAIYHADQRENGDWGLPVLLMSTEDGCLFDAKEYS